MEMIMADCTPPVRTIRSASDEGMAKDDHDTAKQSHDHAARPPLGMAAQVSRSSVKQATDRSAQQFSSGGELTGRTVQGITRQADQALTQTVDFGTLMISSYGAACSELVKQVHQVARCQGEMLNDMLYARSPSDVLLAGNRYWLGGLQAFFNTNARVAQTLAHAADETGQKRHRRTD
jgi:hypothetical protein